MKIVAWSVVILVVPLLALRMFFVGYYRTPQNATALMSKHNNQADRQVFSRGEIAGSL
jgi:hypothetical protein